MVKYASKRRYRRRNTRRTRKVSVLKKAAPATYSGVKKLVNKMILKRAESKHTNANIGKIELYHNIMSTIRFNETGAMPSQGTGDMQRVGDSINIGGYYLRLLCGQKQDRPNVSWRFLIVKVPKDTTVSYATFFDNVTGNVMLDNPNKDKVTVLYNRTIHKFGTTHLAYAAGGTPVFKESTFPVKIWLPYKKIVKFQQDGTTTHTDGDLYLVTLAYDAFGTLTTDNIAYIQVTSTMYFKDP